ncbi:hypothetical protein [Pelomonas sp. Root1444]|uniref:hypothetical protein n=1 Tax=Pelomonas sp. Root1444 TaxID=1736464 RepID=UPI000703200A|nr:hypothetical protein [Pelomonas sp. Root1444]KQY88935.1 hypothetical protein ASD35_15545 [Pelomonas sp. Root1444]
MIDECLKCNCLRSFPQCPDVEQARRGIGGCAVPTFGLRLREAVAAALHGRGTEVGALRPAASLGSV